MSGPHAAMLLGDMGADVTPVLSMAEAPDNAHLLARGTLARTGWSD